MYRKFWLANALNEKYDLTTKLKSAFLHEPEGFGFTKTFSSIRVGNSELVTTQQYTLTDIKGELLFWYGSNGDKYQEYFDFIQFCKYKPITFHYQTPNDLSSYHCDVIFTIAEKGEIDEVDGMLHVPVTFHRLTEWLTDEDIIYTMDNTPIGDGKKYDLTYDYSYAGTNLSNTIITNNGTDDVGFVLIVDGEVQNMQFTLTQGGEVYGICKINGTYDYVMVDSIERTESIYLESGGSVITNPEQYQDFTVRNGASYLTWTKLKVGQTLFNFTCGNIDTFDGTVTLKFANSYATV